MKHLARFMIWFAGMLIAVSLLRLVFGALGWIADQAMPPAACIILGALAALRQTIRRRNLRLP